jgi:hypothetical protein
MLETEDSCTTYALIEAILCQPHESGLLFYQQHKLGCALDVGDLVDQAGNSFATHTHLGTVNEIAIFNEIDATDDHSLDNRADISCHYCQDIQLCTSLPCLKLLR